MQIVTIREQEGWYLCQKLVDDSDVLSEMRTPNFTYSGAAVHHRRLPRRGNTWEINWYQSGKEDDRLKVVFPKGKDAVSVSVRYWANYTWGPFQGEIMGEECWEARHW